MNYTTRRDFLKQAGAALTEPIVTSIYAAAQEKPAPVQYHLQDLLMAIHDKRDAIKHNPNLGQNAAVLTAGDFKNSTVGFNVGDLVDKLVVEHPKKAGHHKDADTGDYGSARLPSSNPVDGTYVGVKDGTQVQVVVHENGKSHVFGFDKTPPNDKTKVLDGSQLSSYGVVDAETQKYITVSTTQGMSGSEYATRLTQAQYLIDQLTRAIKAIPEQSGNNGIIGIIKRIKP